MEAGWMEAGWLQAQTQKPGCYVTSGTFLPIFSVTESMIIIPTPWLV